MTMYSFRNVVVLFVFAVFIPLVVSGDDLETWWSDEADIQTVDSQARPPLFVFGNAGASGRASIKERSERITLEEMEREVLKEDLLWEKEQTSNKFDSQLDKSLFCFKAPLLPSVNESAPVTESFEDSASRAGVYVDMAYRAERLISFYRILRFSSLNSNTLSSEPVHVRPSSKANSNGSRREFVSSSSFKTQVEEELSISSSASSVSWNVSQDLDVERVGLGVLYTNLLGRAWLIDTNWNEKGVSYCEWFGVICGTVTVSGEKRNTVVGVHLLDNGLRGSIGVGILKLSNLITLDLSSTIYATVPNNIFYLAVKSMNLPFLTTLRISHSSLVSVQAVEWGGATSLKYLDLSLNSLVSLPDAMFPIPTLEWLDVSAVSCLFDVLPFFPSLNLSPLFSPSPSPSPFLLISLLPFRLSSTSQSSDFLPIHHNLTPPPRHPTSRSTPTKP